MRALICLILSLIFFTAHTETSGSTIRPCKKRQLKLMTNSKRILEEISSKHNLEILKKSLRPKFKITKTALLGLESYIYLFGKMQKIDSIEIIDGNIVVCDATFSDGTIQFNFVWEKKKKKPQISYFYIRAVLINKKNEYSNYVDKLKKSINGKIGAMKTVCSWTYYGSITGTANRSLALRWYKLVAESGDPEAMRIYGSNLYSGKFITTDKDKAMEYIKKSAEKGDTEAHVLLGIAFKNELKFKESFRYFMKAAQKGDPYSECSIAYYYSLGAGVRQDKVKAEIWARKAVNQNYVPAMNLLAYILAQNENFCNEALRLIREALKDQPDRASYLDTYGFILFKQKKYKEALIQLLKAEKLSPDHPENIAHIGDVYFALHQTNAASKAWEKALELVQKNSELPENYRKQLIKGLKTKLKILEAVRTK
ncbi:MAG: tetratricopeptide repeat protein [Lentisphaerae bacterium]|nr:tetratricopeptide repeat protein [Lentisphaerota bacterium]MCP4102575.1 tetratricopeptide repeat protein [Lentisphaerota bacterium]